MRGAAARRWSTALALLALAGGRAAGSPLEDSAQGGSVFTGPTHPHASSIFLSPAALALAGLGQHFFVGGTLRFNHNEIDRQEIDLDTGQLSEGASVSANTWAPGGMVGFYTSIGDNASFGAAIHTPFSAEFITAEDELRYHVLGGGIRQTTGSLAATYRLTTRFAFGLGLSLGYTQLDLDLARDTALESGSNTVRGTGSDCGNGVPCGVENPAAAETMRMTVGTEGVAGLFAQKNLGFTASIAIQPVNDWWAVVTYVSPPGAFFDLDLAGEVEIERAPRDGGDVLRGESEIIIRLPDSVLLGVRGPLFPGYDLVAGVRWQNASRQDQLDIRTFGGDLTGTDVPEWYPRYRGFEDTIRIDGGLERQEDAVFRYGGRLRAETGAVNASKVTPLQIEGIHFGVGAGAELRIAQYVVVTATYDANWFPALESTRSEFDPRDRVTCVDSNFDFDSCEAAREGRATPTAAGTYHRIEQGFSLSVRYDNL